MAVKIIMTWDIAPEREQEYFEFVVREFIPGVQRMGFELSDAWATVFGAQPQIMVGAVLPSANEAKQLLATEEWKSLNNQLQDFVYNYSHKLVPARGGFQF
ncbi:MAG: hypothetical protein GYA17_21820 [Chloroflexi bacterium]|nr:hypothetical protein [Anaerolineaceae bacterium]NMB91007.1 hypothetical protein [Chloroflexota bacterium]